MANTLELGNGKWATGKDTVLAFNDENNNFKPLPFSFSRDTSGTVVNKDGLIETVGVGEPRIDFKDNTKGALLLEPERTNLIEYSEDFSNYYWAKSGAVVISDSAVSPNGTLNADKLNFTASNGEIVKGMTFISGQTYTMSFYAKTESGTLDFAYGNMDYSIISGTATNEWQRFVITQTLPTTTRFPKIQTTEIGSLLLYGFQVEQGSYATSYIPTSGSAVTRSADVCSEGGNSTIFNNNSFTIFSEFIRDGFDTDSAGVALGLRNPSNSEQIRLHFDAPTKFVRFRDALNGFATIGGYIPISLNEKMKLSLSVNGSTAKVFSNGVQVGSDYTGITPFNIDEMVLNGRLWKVKDVRYYNTALTDQELIALTQ